MVQMVEVVGVGFEGVVEVLEQVFHPGGMVGSRGSTPLQTNI